MPRLASSSGAEPPQSPTVKPAMTSSPLKGVLLLVLSMWVLSCLDANVKWVLAVGVPMLVLCWMRYLVHLVLVLMLVLPTRGLRVLRSRRPREQLLRGGCMLLATLFFFTTLGYLPQAEATAINFLAPLIVLAAAPWVLGEAPRVSRWIAAGIGFIGVLVVIRPGSGLDPLGVMFGLLSALSFATQFITTRRVAADDPFTTLIWSGAFGTIALTVTLPFALPGALPVLQQLSVGQWLLLLSTGAWGALGHLLQIGAYRNAPASTLAPFVYLQIISASTVGWLVWGHFPDGYTWVGIAIICGSGLGIALLEWRRNAQASRMKMAGT